MINPDHPIHLDRRHRVNLGSYYTEGQYVDIVWRMLVPHLMNDSVILDSSCGYGNFLRPEMPHIQIGGDIDAAAIQAAREIHKEGDVSLYTSNALASVGRGRYHITDAAHLCVIGNPPYNDRTSLVRSNIKRSDTASNAAVDPDLRTRDLGLSFLLSYQKLRADVVCVLHPLSYLIKLSNFNALRSFTNQYRLIDGKIISSGVFKETSKRTRFPILVALYKKDVGIYYQEVLSFNFDVIGGQPFSIGKFDNVSRHVRKYPDKRRKPRPGDILFWTLRDINALKRNRTFVDKHSANTIIVDPRELDYYVYIDVFKQFSRHVPYYFGNCDPLIDHDLFQDYKEHFIVECLSRHERLVPHFAGYRHDDKAVLAQARNEIRSYFKQLLGVHYVP